MLDPTPGMKEHVSDACNPDPQNRAAVPEPAAARGHTVTCSMPWGGGGTPKFSMMGTDISLGYTSICPAKICR